MRTVKFLVLTVGALPTEYDPYDVSYQYDNSQYDYSYMDYGDIDKGKNKKKKEMFDSKQQLDPAVVTEPSAYNGHQCWTCNSDSYADCQSNGQLAYCESEEFNCFIREHKVYEDIIKVHMGCQQTQACHQEFLNNNRFYGMNMPVIAGMDLGNFRQCFPEDPSQNVSTCRQCCEGFLCNNAWKDGSLDTDAEWNDTTDHGEV